MATTIPIRKQSEASPAMGAARQSHSEERLPSEKVVNRESVDTQLPLCLSKS
jgi:hypothetical protein